MTILRRSFLGCAAMIAFWAHGARANDDPLSAGERHLTAALRSTAGSLRARLASERETARPRPTTACFQRHIQGALRTNRERLPLYARASGGASERISKRLIGLEELSLLPARYLDRRAKPYQEAGVPLLCEDFVPMSEAPPFGLGGASPPPQPLRGWDAEAIGREIRSFGAACRNADGFTRLARRLDDWLDALAPEPRYRCMARHVLASIRRAAELAPRYDEAARRRGLPSSLAISWRFIWLQSLALGQAEELDRWAVAVQQQGVPILCNDVPPIPAPGPREP